MSHDGRLRSERIGVVGGRADTERLPPCHGVGRNTVDGDVGTLFLAAAAAQHQRRIKNSHVGRHEPQPGLEHLGGRGGEPDRDRMRISGQYREATRRWTEHERRSRQQVQTVDRNRVDAAVAEVECRAQGVTYRGETAVPEVVKQAVDGAYRVNCRRILDCIERRSREAQDNPVRSAAGGIPVSRVAEMDADRVARVHPRRTWLNTATEWLRACPGDCLHDDVAGTPNVERIRQDRNHGHRVVNHFLLKYVHIEGACRQPECSRGRTGGRVGTPVVPDIGRRAAAGRLLSDCRIRHTGIDADRSAAQAKVACGGADEPRVDSGHGLPELARIPCIAPDIRIRTAWAAGRAEIAPGVIDDAVVRDDMVRSRVAVDDSVVGCAGDRGVVAVQGTAYDSEPAVRQAALIVGYQTPDRRTGNVCSRAAVRRAVPANHASLDGVGEVAGEAVERTSSRVGQVSNERAADEHGGIGGIGYGATPWCMVLIEQTVCCLQPERTVYAAPFSACPVPSNGAAGEDNVTALDGAAGYTRGTGLEAAAAEAATAGSAESSTRLRGNTAVEPAGLEARTAVKDRSAKDRSAS